MKNARQIKDNQFLIDLSFNTSNFYGVPKVQKSKIIYHEILKKKEKEEEEEAKRTYPYFLSINSNKNMKQIN